MKGYANRILNVDLSENTVKATTVDEENRKRFLGGSGLGAKILWDMKGFNSDPLSADNPLIFMTGPFANTPALTSGRHAVVSRSPLTGLFAESDAGGTWGATLKRAGYDGIVVTGKAKTPVYLWVSENSVEIRPAGHLWGKDTYATDETLRKETNEKAVTSCIGPAGEKQVLISAIINDGRAARAAGRCGLGAVMGSKNLKAVTVFGTAATILHDKNALTASLKELAKEIKEKLAGMSMLGTPGSLAAFEEMGSLPLMNWKGTERWKNGAAKITGATLANTMLTGKYGCERCVVRCGREIHIKSGTYAGLKGAGPEYETLASLGSLCLVSDLEAIAFANDMCNRYGVDTISVGNIVAFAMEAYEKKIFSIADTGGIELTWGNADAMVETVRLICENSGLGAILSKGVRQAAKEIGMGSEEFAVHSNGLEFPLHDPRAYMTLAVEYATSARGACHLSGFSHCFERAITLPEIGLKVVPDRLSTENKGVLTAISQDVMGVLDSLKVCKFMLFGGMKLTHMVDWYRFITGEDADVNRFMQAGERIFNLKRLFNLKCGLQPIRDDSVPTRILRLPKEAEGWNTRLCDFPEMIREYYAHRGWDSQGLPTAEKIESLGLDAN